MKSRYILLYFLWLTISYFFLCVNLYLTFLKGILKEILEFCIEKLKEKLIRKYRKLFVSIDCEPTLEVHKKVFDIQI